MASSVNQSAYLRASGAEDGEWDIDLGSQVFEGGLQESLYAKVPPGEYE